MNTYEITYLTDPNLAEEARDELHSAIDGRIAELNGSVKNESPSLRRKLAYPIKKQVSAFIRTIQAEIDPAKSEEVRDALKKNEHIVRFTILNTPKREEVSPEIMEKATKGRGGKAKKFSRDAKDAKPQKKVSMEDVEKGIEDALSEEVK